jgi:hypothetical protein
MFNRKVDARAEAVKRASLSIVWGAIAGVAYLGLIKRAVDLIATSTPWAGLSVGLDSGLIATGTGALGAKYGPLATTAVAALPIAIVAVIALGIAARVRPGAAAFAGLLLAAALLGLAGVSLLFLAVVVNVKNGTEFVVALVTIVAVSILLRLQRFVRRFYRRSPAGASLLFAVATLAYLILGNGANISSIILSQVDIWLSLVAFGIVLYASITLLRLGQLLRRGR